MSFVFDNTETTGSDALFEQILQSAAIRAEDAKNEIDCSEIRCRTPPHNLLAPIALIVTGITLDQLSDPRLPSHFEVATVMQQKLTEWLPTVFPRYNSLEFDEELLRKACCRRMDVLGHRGSDSGMTHSEERTSEAKSGIREIPRRRQFLSVAVNSAVVSPSRRPMWDGDTDRVEMNWRIALRFIAAAISSFLNKD